MYTLNLKVSELERKMNLCKDVPSLTTRVSKGTGLMEMVAQLEDGDPSAVRYGFILGFWESSLGCVCC